MNEVDLYGVGLVMNLKTGNLINIFRFHLQCSFKRSFAGEYQNVIKLAMTDRRTPSETKSIFLKIYSQEAALEMLQYLLYIFMPSLHCDIALP
jgi:hypothetical protein